MLFDNLFYKSIDVSDVSQVNEQRFRKVHESKKKKQKVVAPDAPQISEQVLKPKQITSKSKIASGPQTDKLRQKATSLKLTAVNVNSIDRDVALYPKASDFNIYLNKTFKNIYKVKLLSTEWPNTDNVVKDSPASVQNNIIAWVNQEDADIGFPIYKAYIRPGTYTTSTLQNEVSSKMNKIKSRGGTGSYHTFGVTIDKNTQIMTFRRLVNKLLPLDGFAFTVDSNDVTVTLPHHGITVGTQIYISGFRQTIGTITSTILNSDFSVTSVLDSDRFVFEIPIPSSIAAIGGGISTNIGTMMPFKLKFGSGQRGTLGSIIGFPDEDSNVLLNQTDPLTPYVISISGVSIGYPTLFTSPAHGLRSGMMVRIQGLKVLPAIDTATPYTIFSVPDSDSFVINISTSDIEQASIATTLIGTELMNVNFPSHGFNQIVDIQAATGGKAAVTTLLPHGLTPGSEVILNSTDSTPSINGLRIVLDQPTDDTFTVFVNGTDMSTSLTVDGTSGVIGNSLSFQLYNSIGLGNVIATDINNRVFTIDRIEDADNFLFILPNMNTTDNTSGGGTYVSISSDLHGFSGVQTNTDADNNLVRPLTLSGDSYVFLCLRDLGCIVNTGPVDDIFAKILLDKPPGDLLFNTYVPGPGKIFDEMLLTSLTTLGVSVRTHANAAFDFNNVNFSFTLEITEIIESIVDQEETKEEIEPTLIKGAPVTPKQ